MQCCNSDFWRYFKNKKNVVNNNITLSDFKDHFASMFADVNHNLHDESENFDTSHVFDDYDPIFENLDAPITYDEVCKAIKSLKSRKSAGEDKLLNEYFSEASDILAGYITDIFNKVLDSGVFPEAWTKGIIVPIHKKGDKNDCKNYRGITLLSNFGKLFTSVLNKRITFWCEENNTISDAQFGFRKGRSTVDAIFILQSLIERYVNANKRLYCCFIDLKRCFDTIYRNALWLKLFRHGMNGKMLRIIRNMYQYVTSCVKGCDSYSDYFEIAVGLRQGEIISPIMFSLFVEDLELYLQDRIDCGLNTNDLCLILLLFADDMCIVGNSPEDLQASLNRLYEYCNNWGLEVNVDKSKVVVFRKRGGVRLNESWLYGNESLDVVNDFNYLGVTLNYTGNFNLNVQTLHGKALKAMNALLSRLKQYNTMPKVALQLFDSFVSPILSYGCEVWGFSKSKQLENIHLKFCKNVLGVRQSTSNVAVYGELGRYPLYINRYIRIIKYWFKLCNTDNIILKASLLDSQRDTLQGKLNWCTHIRNMLARYGFLEVYDNVMHVDANVFIPLFRQRLIDEYLQQWRESLSNNNVLTLYVYVKDTLSMESYLQNIISRKLRVALTQIRVSAHSLRIQTGRYGKR